MNVIPKPFRSYSLRSTVCTLLFAAAVATAPMLAQEPSAQPQPAQAPHGQWQGGPHGRGGMDMHHLAKALNLTEDQKTQIKAIHEAGRQQLMALHEDTTPKEAKREKMMAFHQEQEAKVKAVLTAEQLTKYEAIQQKMKERRSAHQGGAPSTPAA